MRPALALLSLVLLIGCRDARDTEPTRHSEPATQETSRFPAILAPLLDPDKLDALKGKRAATPRLRKACYWLETAQREGQDMGKVIDQAHTLTGPHRAARLKAQRDSLLRNVAILDRLGCLDVSGMIKLRKGNTPTITRGPYTGEIVTGDHIIPRSVCEELDERIYNLEFLPFSLNQKKSDKVGQRQIDLARKWHGDGLLTSRGLESVMNATR